MKRESILSILYFAGTFLGCISWVLCFEIYHFLGASSIVYSFIFAVATESAVMTIVYLFWLLLLLSALIFTFVIALKKHFFIPFWIVTGADLCFSLFVALYSVIYSSGPVLIGCFFGLVVRVIYFIYLFRCIRQDAS